MLRSARFAGSWYPGSPEILREKLEAMCPLEEPRSVLGIVAPHAGYVYSGRIAGEVYGRVEVPPLVVVLAPNHTGVGPAFSLYPEGSWRTPLGEIPVSGDLNQELMVACAHLQEDYSAHEGEHAAELQLPFLQFRNPDVEIAVIVIRSHQYARLENLGQALAEVAGVMERPLLVVASSDMNHFDNEELTQLKDKKALAEVEALAPERLLRVVEREAISMCGVAPTVAMLTYAKLRGATRAELLAHATSGDVSGDYQRVVGYAAVAVS